MHKAVKPAKSLLNNQNETVVLTFNAILVGRCIKRQLVCNVDNDCGDFSDEDNCESNQQSLCCNHAIDVSEVGRTAGQGYAMGTDTFFSEVINVLGMQPMASPFDNDFFTGLHERVRDGNTRTYYRKPWNVGWKRPLRSLSPTVNLTLPRPPLHHVPKRHIYTAFKYLQGWRLNHFPGQPLPMLDHPFSKEIFPNIQSKPPLAQLEAVSSCPIACYLGEETDPHLPTTSFQVVVESDKVSPQPPFLQAKQPQVPQPLLIRLLRCPSLDTLQPLNVSLVVRGPTLNTAFEVQPHQCQIQRDDHFPSPAGHTISDTSQDVIGLLGHLGTLLAHIQAAVNQHSQVLFCQAAFQPLFPKPVALHGVVVTQTKADKTFTSEFYHDHVKMLQEVYIEKQKYFNADMSLKYTPTEGSNKNGSEGNFKYHYSKNTSLSSILKSFTERNQTFLHVKGKIQLARFQSRSHDVHLTDSFLDDLNFLPAEYDKEEYFKFLEDYGTHYAVSGTVGGKYELVYVLDDYTMSQIGITVEDVKRCLSYHLDANIAYKDLNANVNINGGKCEKINVKDNSELKADAVIDGVISFVDGGKIDFSVKIKEMLLQGSKMVDIEGYIQWAKSLVDAPVVIQQRPSLIHKLVPVKMRNAYLKKQNLERAIEDYITEYSVCKCEPCKNGGTLVLVDGACTCICSSYFKGIACQIPKSTLTK
ncbi:hypothetical protein QYF61_007317, partial [Mycteria americana]